MTLTLHAEGEGDGVGAADAVCDSVGVGVADGDEPGDGVVVTLAVCDGVRDGVGELLGTATPVTLNQMGAHGAHASTAKFAPVVALHNTARVDTRTSETFAPFKRVQ